MALASGTKLGQYEIIDAIGAGGMGEVYRARDTKLDRDVAIKVLPEAFAKNEERLARFEREAKLLAQLNHANIATLHGLEEHDGQKFIVMELVEGETLAERIARGPISIDASVSLLIQIAEGLDAAHGKGIIHRDLKPANIKIGPDGKPKILDFGLAKTFMGDDDEEPASGLSQSPTRTKGTALGAIMGTPGYMSPEQAKGRTVDKRTDIWAFGVVSFEMLTGQRPFSGETASETMASVIKDEPRLDKLPAKTPQHIRWLVRRCLTKDQTERLRDIGEARITLERPETPIETSGGSSVRDRSSLLLAAAALLLGSLITGVTIWSLVSDAPRPLVRFIATPPSSGPLSMTESLHPDVAITPDGTRVVYAVAPDGRRHLLIRALDGLEATRLTGPEDFPTGPFISPDGNWVGYINRGELKRVSIHGGPSVLIVDPPGTTRGASWGDDGTIVFATTRPDGLWRVSAEGGEPEALKHSDPSAGNYLWPEILPGSQAVLFTTTRGTMDDAQLSMLLLETGVSKVVVSNAIQARYVRTGHIVYGIEGTLRAVGFDLETLEVTSDPVLVLDEVVTKASGAADFAVARDGSLLYIKGSVLQEQRTVVWVDRQGQEEALPAAPRRYITVQLSPDADRVAIGVRAQEDDIWIWDFGRENLTRLTVEPGHDRFPVWTPDGLRIAFASGSTGNLVWKPADGTGGVELLADVAHFRKTYFFSPDGQRFVFGADHPERGSDLAMIELDGGSPSVPLIATGFREDHAAISPEGRFLAYQSNESGQFEVYVRPFPNVEDGKWQFSREGGERPLWAPNGRELFYINLDGQIMAVPVDTEHVTEFGKAELVVERRYFINSSGRVYDVSPDGQRFLVIKEEEFADAELIFVMNWVEELKRLVPAGN